MTRETIARANNLLESQENLKKLRRIVDSTYPFRILSKKKSAYIAGILECDQVIELWNFDKVTANELRAAILGVIERRQVEIEDELKEM